MTEPSKPPREKNGRPRTKVRAKLVDGITRLRILIDHPMHTGRQKDSAGTLIPPHFIEHLKIEHNGRVVVDARLSTAVSSNPYLSFRFRGGNSGDTIRISWQDNLGQTDRQETKIP